MDLQLSAQTRGVRTVSLTALIDVVFILLLFFMLTARLSPQAGIAVSLNAQTAVTDGGRATPGSGDRPDRLVIGPTGLWLNEVAIDWDALTGSADAAGRLRPGPLVLAPLTHTPLQTLLDARDRLVARGWPAASLTMQLTRAGTAPDPGAAPPAGLRP